MKIDVEALYRRYGDMVLGRCRALLGDEADAQETCQEIFLKLHRYRRRFRAEAKPSTYLFKVTTTTCLNRIRTRTRRREELVEQPPVTAAQDSLLEVHERRDLIRHLLDEADEKTQACVVYHYMDGMTYREVSELVGVGPAAVRKRVSTFRRRLAKSPPAWLEELDP